MIDVFNINDLIYKMNVNMNVDSENSNQQTMKYKDVVDKIRHIISKSVSYTHLTLPTNREV